VPELVVASFNVHAGVDGWGRPYDVVGACRALDADVLVLQEAWTADGGQSQAGTVANALGAWVVDVPLATGRLLGPPIGSARAVRWQPPRRERRLPALALDRRALAPKRRDLDPGAQGRTRAHGQWGIAVLCRLPVLASRVVDLGALPLDPARRAAVVVDVDVAGVQVPVVATHLSHLSHGSPVHLRRVRRVLPPSSGPGVLAGDMNLWGPPLSAALPGWRRAPRGRTWPAWRPLAQLDHILVTRSVEVLGAEVVPVGGSDHLPVRARLRVEGAGR